MTTDGDGAAQRGADVRDVRRNFVLNVLEGAFYLFAIQFTSRTTVLPLLVREMGGGAVAVALIPVLWIVGFNMPQILIANYTRHAPDKKRLLLRTTLAQRLPWLVLALFTGWALQDLPGWGALLAFFILFGLAAFLGALSVPPWFDVVVKLTPVQMRGRLFATRVVLTGILGVGAGIIVEVVLERWAYPHSFALLFGFTFAAMMVSYGCIALLRHGAPDPPRPAVPYRKFLRELPEILRREPNFRRFLIADALLIASITAEGFYTVYAFDRFGLSVGYAGRFTMVLMASAVLGSLAFGYLGDRFGHKLNLVLMGVCTLTACTLALLAPTVEVYYLVFVASAFAYNLQVISRLPMIAEICGERDRPIYVALTNVITSPFALIGLAAGWLGGAAGLGAVFVVLGGVALAAVVWLVAVFEEPRRVGPIL